MALPDHMFIGEGGILYDTRTSRWHWKPLRKDYCRTYGSIRTVAQLKATLRNGEYAWPGGYPMYFITDDGGALSFDTVRAELRSVIDSIRNQISDGWRVVACDVNWEDTTLYDDHTGERIPSAYGSDDDDDGLQNSVETVLGTDRYSSDTDGDGLPDEWEVFITRTDPLSP